MQCSIDGHNLASLCHFMPETESFWVSENSCCPCFQHLHCITSVQLSLSQHFNLPDVFLPDFLFYLFHFYFVCLQHSQVMVVILTQIFHYFTIIQFNPILFFFPASFCHDHTVEHFCSPNFILMSCLNILAVCSNDFSLFVFFPHMVSNQSCTASGLLFQVLVC